ncbi:hypothetical protein GCM10010495_77390 [Kitasatospora herbaricolor]|uniref:hypothetical protein n=1 Tax=Kitasatospora herbaricolor TaxID=68217 RepID=UPI00174E1C93|nr:hypothetical protein [Kitasatospora herbaricolor]MDQ0305816.1 hypothetical protein [Kitasatospora herbaricolor]GGV48095.1 hypothetical protein GCM10010495_77390 [Kitasatospora herbaricolor]
MTELTAPSRSGLRIEAITLVHASGEMDKYTFNTAGLNIVQGIRNSSKTTTLNAIDYCLGNRSSPADALKAAVADEYTEILADLTINGDPTEIRRSLEHGRQNKVVVNGNEFPVAEFSGRILRALRWPDLSIPKGIHAASATELVPLSFRSVLRHIYRNEDSWTKFADKEQEFHRRAVISFLLGFAPARYNNNDFAVAAAQRNLAQAQAAEREVHDSTDRAIAALCENLQLPIARTQQQVDSVRVELRAELDSVHEQRRRLTQEVELLVAVGAPSGVTPGYDPTLSGQYERATQELAQAAETVADLEQVLAAHIQSQNTVKAEIARMDRLIASVDVFGSLPVRLCPACEQKIDTHRDHPEGSCYVCMQPVTDDQRRRRGELEQRSLTAEAEDLEDVVTRTRRDLHQAKADHQGAQSRHHDLAARLNTDRAASLAPFVSTLEEMAARLAQLQQKLMALPVVDEMITRKAASTEAAEAAARRLDQLQRQSEEDPQLGMTPLDRCAVFAERMNEFLDRHRDDVWVTGNVAISADDLTFYVGTRPWHQALGAEAMVLFFLAYSRALLFLAQDMGGDCPYPGLLMLDNPFQHGIANEVVHGVLRDIAEAARQTGAQVISTQAVPVPSPAASIKQIRMPRTYIGESPS